VTIAREVELKDPDENLGVKLIREAAERTGGAVGDGTSTATMVAHAILVDRGQPDRGAGAARRAARACRTRVSTARPGRADCVYLRGSEVVIASAAVAESSALRIVELSGMSEESWADAVWEAIAPALRRGCRVVGLNVPRHSTASHDGRTEYRVHDRLSFVPGRRSFGSDRRNPVPAPLARVD
jgi:hypothetical protein